MCHKFLVAVAPAVVVERDTGLGACTQRVAIDNGLGVVGCSKEAHTVVVRTSRVWLGSFHLRTLVGRLDFLRA